MTSLNYELLAELVNLGAIGGFEHEASYYLQKLSQPFVDNSWVDPVGNCVLQRVGTSEKTVVIEAHLDEIGFMVRDINAQGQLLFTPVGYFDDRNLVGKRVLVRNKECQDIPGVIISLTEFHNSIVNRDNLVITVGAKNKEGVENLGILQGSPITYYGPLEQLDQGLVGKAFDLRLGCYVILEVLKRLKADPGPLTVYGLLTVQEEIGRKGVRGIINRLKPDLAIITEIAPARTYGYQPAELPIACGLGPVLTVAQATNDSTDPDGGYICNPRLLQKIKNVALKKQIALQLDAIAADCSTFVTNAGVTYTLQGGLDTCLISVPYRYMHTSSEMCFEKDLLDTVNLIEALVKTEELI